MVKIMWTKEKCRKLSELERKHDIEIHPLDKSHLIKAKKIVESWPKWKQECPYTTSSDPAFSEDK